MLPKPEKKSRKDPEQLDLVKTIRKDEDHRGNRLYIIIILILTIGISLGFWSYRLISTMLLTHQYPQFSLNFPKFKLPQFASPSPATFTLTNLETVVSPIIATDKSSWSFYLANTSGPIWQKGDSFPATQTAEILAQLKQQPVNQSSLSSVLPQGLPVADILSSTPTSVQDAILIILPHDSLFLIIKAADTPSPDIARSLFPSLTSALYWAVTTN